MKQIAKLSERHLEKNAHNKWTGVTAHFVLLVYSRHLLLYELEHKILALISFSKVWTKADKD